MMSFIWEGLQIDSLRLFLFLSGHWLSGIWCSLRSMGIILMKSLRIIYLSCISMNNIITLLLLGILSLLGLLMICLVPLIRMTLINLDSWRRSPDWSNLRDKSILTFLVKLSNSFRLRIINNKSKHWSLKLMHLLKILNINRIKMQIKSLIFN
jgi:hypothetical protein